MLSVVLAIMLAIHPGHVPPKWLASAVARAVDTTALPAGWSRELSAAVLLETAWEEGRWSYASERGDKHSSPVGAVTTYQIHAVNEAHARALEADPAYASRYALWLIVEGTKICPDAPLAPYAGGCRSAAARAISERRMRLAADAASARPQP